MADIVTSYTYTNGNVLSASGHNQNLQSSTATEGIYTESNGSLSSANFASAFRVTDEHVLPGSVIIAASQQGMKTLHYYSDIVGSSNAVKYIVMEGCRFRLPFDASTLWLNTTFFMSPWLWMNGSEQAYISARTQLWFDGSALPESEYPVPVGAEGPGAVNAERPVRFAVERPHQVLIKDTSLITRGDHEFSIRLYMGDNPPLVSGVWPTAYDTPDDSYLHGRVSIGYASMLAIAHKKTNS